jgi:hypothetical protein
MKAIFTILIALFAATFTFANNGEPTKGAPVKTEISTETAKISTAMDAVLNNLIVNNTLATTATTMDKATAMTIVSNEQTIVTDRFVVHTFGETTTSDRIAPVAVATETIELDAEEL